MALHINDLVDSFLAHVELVGVYRYWDNEIVHYTGQVSGRLGKYHRHLVLSKTRKHLLYQHTPNDAFDETVSF